MPASMLDLPRELYLIVCELLTPTELSKLAGVSRDHYIAVQHPLYSNITITAFDKLVKLVGTLTKRPVVSKISAKQRLRWQSLSDAQLRERDIKHLDLILDSRISANKNKMNGMLLSRCIGVVSKSSNAVRINMTLHGSWSHLLSQLQAQALPDVRKLVMYLGGEHMETKAQKLLWDLCFSGSAFPDLREVQLDTLFSTSDERPVTLNESAKVNQKGYWSPGHDNFMPFYGLKKMSSIKLTFNDILDAGVLGSLFGSNIVPQNLTRLDISYCPSLQFTKDLGALSMLIQRGLQLLQHFKLHLCKLSASNDWDWNYDQIQHEYCRDITDNPDWHLCNVVREAGQKIKSLDLALPFVCSRMFVPKAKKPSTANVGLDYPLLPREPYETLPERLLAAGYKHRRLICWNGICRQTDEWDDIKDLASNQGDMMSWELANADNKCASWHVSDCLPFEYKSRDVVKRPLARVSPAS